VSAEPVYVTLVGQVIDAVDVARAIVNDAEPDDES
jgi:hypothetical protein